MTKEFSRRGFVQILAAALTSTKLKVPVTISGKDVGLVEYEKVPWIIFDSFGSGATKILDIDNDLGSPLDSFSETLVRLLKTRDKLSPATMSASVLDIMNYQVSKTSSPNGKVELEIVNPEKYRSISLRDYINESSKDINSVLESTLEKMRGQTSKHSKMYFLDQRELDILEELLKLSSWEGSSKKLFAKEIYRLNCEVASKELAFPREQAHVPEFKNPEYKSVPSLNEELVLESMLPKKPALEGFDMQPLPRLQNIMKPEEGIDYRRRREMQKRDIGK